MKCEDHECVRTDPDSDTPVYEGPGVRIDETREP